MISKISAVAAYQKALEANKKIKQSFDVQHKNFQPNAVLKIGDDLTILKADNKVNLTQSNDALNLKPSFSNILENELLHQPIRSVSQASNTMFELTQSDGRDVGPNQIDLIKAIDTAQLTVNTMVAIRDKVVDAYKSILNMPL